MMTKSCAILVSALLLCNAVSAATPEIEPVGTGEAPSFSRIDIIKSAFNKALAREEMDTLESALYAYNSVLLNAEKVLNSGSADYAAASAVLPYYIASAYRKGIVTNRYIEGSVIELYRQIKLFNEADKWIQQAQTAASNYSLEKGLPVTGQMLGLLYYSKAYNRLGWSFAVLNGSLWKRYIIYPPSDTVKMVEKSMDDLKKMIASYGFVHEKGKALNSSASISSYINSLSEDGIEFRTLSLCYSRSDKKAAQKILARQLEMNAVRTLDLFSTAAVQASLQKGRLIFTFEDILKPETKDLADAISRLLAEMEVK